MTQLEREIRKLVEDYKGPPEKIATKIEFENANLEEKLELLLHIGAFMFNLSYFTYAISTWKRALNYSKKIQDKCNQIRCFINIGYGYEILGELNKALKYSQKAMALSSEIDDWKIISNCHGCMGIIQFRLGNFKDALENLNQVLEIETERGNKIEILTAWGNLGVLYRNLGESKKAFQCYIKMAKMKNLGKFDDMKSETFYFMNLGTVYYELGKIEKAERYYKKAIKRYNEAGNRYGEAYSYLKLATAYRDFGQFSQGENSFQKALDIMKEIGDQIGIARCYLSLSIFYSKLGDYKKSNNLIKKALIIRKKIKDRPGLSECYLNLAINSDKLGSSHNALKNFKKALLEAQSFGDVGGTIICLINIGHFYINFRKFQEAYKYLKKALEISRKIGDEIAESYCLANFGTLFKYCGDFEKALDYYLKTLILEQKRGDLENMRITNIMISRLYKNRFKDPIKAYLYCKKSIDLYEQIMMNIVDEENKLVFASDRIYSFRLMICLCLELGRPSEALEYVERSKSRSFLEILGAAKIFPTVKLTPKLKTLLNEEEHHLEKLRQYKLRNIRYESHSLSNGILNADIPIELNRFYTKLRYYDPKYVSYRKIKSLRMNEIRRLLICN